MKKNNIKKTTKLIKTASWSALLHRENLTKCIKKYAGEDYGGCNATC
ncbi:MAG: hypothetical protein HQM16_01050 [Deltaproteobacteria bacterium]|nr:hypothetical protein [Deltaproteobacteria bacterium]